MNAKPTYEELEEKVKELELDRKKHVLTDKTLFDLKRPKDLINPDWPEIKWNITGLFIRRKLLTDVLNFMRQLRISHVLKSFHDAPDVIWNGGRMNMNVKFFDDTATYFKALNARGVGILLTFSNLVLEKKHLDDPESHRLLECLDDKCGLNGVILGSDLLADYLREKKPGLSQTTSVVKSFIENPERKVEWYLEMQKRYDRVVIHTDHMFDLDLMDKLDRSKTEILVNEECIYGCPNRRQHQTLTSQFNLDKSDKLKEEIQALKKSSCKGSVNVLQDNRNPDGRRACYLTHEEITAFYNMGFRDFKICGRRKPMNNLAWNIIHYVYNPDLQPLFADWLYTKIDSDTKKAVQQVISAKNQEKSK